MGEEDSAEAAGELGNDVGKCVPAMDAAEPEIGEGDSGVQVGPVRRPSGEQIMRYVASATPVPITADSAMGESEKGRKGDWAL